MGIIARLKRAARKMLGRHPFPKMTLVQMDAIVPTSLEEQVYCAVVQQDDVCYDVGANRGEVARILAKLSGCRGIVIAFEPVWDMYVTLCAGTHASDGSKDSNGVIVTMPFGLADVERNASIQVPDNNFGVGSMAHASSWIQAQPGAAMTSYECRFLTLDGFLQSFKPRIPDFMKIDVEGAELFVLKGARQFFDNGNRPLMLIEVFAPWEKAFNYGPWEVFRLLGGWGYRFLFVCPNGLVEYDPSAAKPFPPDYKQAYNVLAFCPEKHKERISNVEGLRVKGGQRILSMPPPPVANVIS